MTSGTISPGACFESPLGVYVRSVFVGRTNAAEIALLIVEWGLR